MEYNTEQMGILSRYTDDISTVEVMTHYDYTRADSKTVSKLLDEYHIIWFEDDPGNMHLVPKNDP